MQIVSEAVRYCLAHYGIFWFTGRQDAVEKKRWINAPFVRMLCRASPLPNSLPAGPKHAMDKTHGTLLQQRKNYG